MNLFQALDHVHRQQQDGTPRPAGHRFDLDALLDLWSQEPAPGTDPAEPFRRWYADPVRVNGTMVSATDLAARAAAMRSALADQERRILHHHSTGKREVVVFELSGRHEGPFPSSAGLLPPSGATLRLRVIDVLTVRDGRVSEVWMTADELGALSAEGLVAPVRRPAA